MKAIGVLCVLAAAAVCSQACQLSTVNVVRDLDERRFAGTWYEARFYYSPRYTPNKRNEYENSGTKFTVSSLGIGLYAEEWMQRPPTASCKKFNEGMRRRLSTGKYEFRRNDLGKSVLSYVVDTDYDSYFIEFLCLDYRGDACFQPEVIVWYRVPMVNPPVPRHIEEKLSRSNVCVNLNKYLTINHKAPSTACVAPTHPSAVVPGLVSPLYPNYYNYYGYHGNYMGYGHDAELVRVQREALVAEKEKLMSERELFLTQREKLRLEIERLRRHI